MLPYYALPAHKKALPCTNRDIHRQANTVLLLLPISLCDFFIACGVLQLSQLEVSVVSGLQFSRLAFSIAQEGVSLDLIPRSFETMPTARSKAALLRISIAWDVSCHCNYVTVHSFGYFDTCYKLSCRQLVDPSTFLLCSGFSSRHHLNTLHHF